MSVLKNTWKALYPKPFGKLLLSAAVSFKAPYFLSIWPRIVKLEPGRGEVEIWDWWPVHNHIGTVHAIACCNLAEYVGATTLDISLPESHRWIPKGMQVSYLKKAKGRLRGIAVVEDLTGLAADESREVIVPIDILDGDKQVVVHAEITMWITPARRK